MKNSIFFAVLFSFLIGSFPAQSKTRIYGKYCGPGHGDKTWSKKPVDDVDAACKVHDKCCLKRGYRVGEKVQHCSCDKTFLRNLRRAKKSANGKPLSKKGLAAKAVIMSYFTNAPCWCLKTRCVKVPSCKTKKKCTKVAGKKVCKKVPSCKTVKKCTKVTVYGKGGVCKGLLQIPR